METRSQNYLERLPLELRQRILGSVPDVGTLRTTTLSCPAFYDAFREFPVSIITSVLSSEIGPSILPEAVMALEASSIRRRNLSHQDVADIILQKLWLQREKVQRKWTLTDALAASKLHFCVDSFAVKFGSIALREFPSCHGPELEYFPPTQQELERIKRALYRLEIYRTIFPLECFDSGIAARLNTKILPEEFFSQFAQRENEQLACIQYFLAHEVKPAFIDVAFHDFSPDELRCYVLDEFDEFDEEIQRIPSLGLRKLHDIATAGTYEARYELLKNPVSWIGGYSDTIDIALFGYSEEPEYILVGEPFFDDSDTDLEKAR
ncbi:MAG: hypothetical protein M1839_002323 [Geoglossum umbratile]|nr:MAG: hypothetical protein M1839_002323 [Geoglossum umbratile]